MTDESVTVLVAVPLSADPAPVVERAARDAGVRVELLHRPDLLPPQRFVADHRGDPGWSRTPEQEAQWQDLLGRADVLLGLPGDSGDGLAKALPHAPRVAWVQATAAGAGEQLRTAGPAARGPRVTSAAGVHAVPLAEFALAGLLHWAKDVPRLQAQQAAHEWSSRWPMGTLHGAPLLVVGLGGIGREVARLASAHGMTVTGVARRPAPADDVARVVGLDDLAAVAPDHPYVVLALPGTPSTERLVDAVLLRAMPRGVVLVNVGRGSVVDHDALADAVRDGHVRGAVLDVTAPEPLPAGSPLWDLPGVLLSPHTAALTTDEDDRILALFADNLQRFVTGRPLRNLVDPDAGY